MNHSNLSTPVKDKDIPHSEHKIYMTPNGYQLIEEEFSLLKKERHGVVDIVSWAASNGDRSENADYQMGKRRLRQIDGRLHYLQKRLANACVVRSKDQTNKEQVFFGATVTYLDEDDHQFRVQIVGVDEADMKQNKISILSPVARALLGKKNGSEASVTTPSGISILEIIRVEYLDQPSEDVQHINQQP